MLEVEKMEILEFLKSTNPDLEFEDEDELTITDCIDLLMEKITEQEVDYSILSSAFVNRINPERYDDFYTEVLSQYESIEEGEEIDENVIDRIATKFKN